MNKIIIENRTNLKDIEIFPYIMSVISSGRISETSKGKQYCFATKFKDGIFVYADKNKKSDRFVIEKKMKKRKG